MRELTLKGGPADGRVIDEDKICNRNDIRCPVHGVGFSHPWIDVAAAGGVEHLYDIRTGEYIGLKGEGS